MTEAQIGYGTLLQFGDGASPESFTTVGEINDISGPSLSADQQDATHMESTGGWREFIAGLKDGGEVSVEVNLLPNNATQNASAGVLSFFKNQTLKNWQIVIPVSPQVTWGFAARVSDAEPATPIDDKMMMSFTLKITGQPAFLA